LARAQESTNPAPDTIEQAISLYTQGRDAEAIEALRRIIKQREDDIRAWHYLGLTLGRQGRSSDARKAHEKSATFGNKIVDDLLESVPYDSLAERLGPYKLILNEAADSADRFLALSSKLSKSKLEAWTARIELLRDYAQLTEPAAPDNTALKVYKPSEVSIRARILAKPEPAYTEEARSYRVNGTIIVRAILAFDGKVRGIRVIRGLPHGLNGSAIRAASLIRFEPAMSDNKPVSQSVQLVYGFHTY
jgi:TonB family protein